MLADVHMWHIAVPTRSTAPFDRGTATAHMKSWLQSPDRCIEEERHWRPHSRARTHAEFELKSARVYLLAKLPLFDTSLKPLCPIAAALHSGKLTIAAKPEAAKWHSGWEPLPPAMGVRTLNQPAARTTPHSSAHHGLLAGFGDLRPVSLAPPSLHRNIRCGAPFMRQLGGNDHPSICPSPYLHAVTKAPQTR